MELIEVAELCRGRDPGTVLVAHSQTSLQRGLELGEEVVLAAGDDFHSARVRDIDFELDDTVYTLDLGGRLPAELARERAEGLDPERHDIEMHEVLDLLGDLRHLGTVDPTRSDTPRDRHRSRLAPV